MPPAATVQTYWDSSPCDDPQLHLVWFISRAGQKLVVDRGLCDPSGVTLAPPNGKCSNLAFGGAHFDTVFATCGDRVYRRKLEVQGLDPSMCHASRPRPGYTRSHLEVARRDVACNVSTRRCRSD